jgi:hypothetical protein
MELLSHECCLLICKNSGFVTKGIASVTEALSVANIGVHQSPSTHTAKQSVFDYIPCQMGPPSPQILHIYL